MRELLGRFPNVSIEIKSKAGELAHQRSIALTWADGRAVTLLPDQGLSLARPVGQVPFAFHRSTADQATEIMRLRWACEAASSVETVVYVREG